MIATGSSAFIPPIPGLDDIPYLTNETIFSLTDAPEHLIVVGGGPIGIEMAQAHRRLGVKVTLIEGGTILGKDDPDAVAVVRRQLINEGVDLREGAKVESVLPRGNGVSVLVSEDGHSAPIDGSHLLLAVGRRPNVAGLGLDTAGIAVLSEI